MAGEAKTWQDVAEVVMNSWPAGPGNKGWERDQLGGYIGELQERRLTAHGAIVGLRASGSGFIPSAGEVRELALAAVGPPSTADVIAAQERHQAAMDGRVQGLLAP